MMQAMNYFKSKPPTGPNSTAVSGGGNLSPELLGNLFPRGSHLDLYVYISESDYFDQFSDKNALYFTKKGIEYGDWTFGENNDGVFVYTDQIGLTKVRKNEVNSNFFLPST